MSFILDALRKSEHERQRRIGPAIADLAVAPRRSNAMPVLIGVGALLAINLAAVAYFALRDEAPPPANSAAVAVEPVAAALETATAPDRTVAPQQPADATPVAEPPRAVQPLLVQARPAGPSPAPDASPPPAPDPLLLPPPAALPQAALASGPRPATAGDYIPRLDTLPPQATAGLPVLNLDLHIFASDPSQRAVFINGRRYREGDSLPEGVEVVAITADGAVLRHRGQRFLLSRQ